MSSQGTISAPDRADSFEEKLLECWGEWATGGLGTGITRPGMWTTDDPGLAFTEEDILRADRAIAGLPILFKRAIKKIFWFKTAGQREYDIYPAAEDAFRRALHGDD